MTYFSDKTVAFLKALKVNNNREWFLAHKADYETHVKRPAEAFSATMADALAGLTGQRHSSKLYRIYRDVRFSKDKTPYHAHVHISLTPVIQGVPSPSWFFGLEPERLVLGAGIFAFEKNLLELYRQKVAGADGARLAGIIDDLIPQGYHMDEPELKRAPAGFAPDHPRADLLRRKGLAVWYTYPDTKPATDRDVVDQCLTRFQALKPVYDWLIAVV